MEYVPKITHPSRLKFSHHKTEAPSWQSNCKEHCLYGISENPARASNDNI